MHFRTKSNQPSPEGEHLQPGQKVGSYEIVRHISSDLLASLYRARDGAGNHCCLYLVPSQAAADAKFQQSLAKGVTGLQRPKHPALLACQELVDTEQALGLKMEDFDGVSLNDLALAKSPPEGYPNVHEPSVVKQILHSALEVIAAVNAEGMKHLNLNPNMILVGADGRVKVAGLGIMGLMSTELFDALASAGVSPLAQEETAQKLGTIDTLAPEMRHGHSADHRGDIYAVGLVGYWLLTRQKPEASYRAPSEINPKVPLGWNVFIGHCLEKQPTKRYASAKPALRELENVNKLKAGLTEEEREGEEKTKSRKMLFIAAGAVVLLVLLGAMFFMGGDETPGEEPPPPPIAAVPSAEGPPANARFRIQPVNTTITFPKSEQTFKNKQPLELRVEPGQQKVVLSAPRHRPLELDLTFSEEMQEVDIALKPSWVDAAVETQPGTKVTATDTEGTTLELGTVTESGQLEVRRKLIEGEYTFAYEHPDFFPVEMPGVAVIYGHPNVQKVNLAPRPARLKVTAENPANMTLLRDGEELGQTPLELEDLPTGRELTFTYTHPEYREGTFTVTLDPNANESYTIPAGTLRTAFFTPAVELLGVENTPALLDAVELNLLSRRTEETTQPERQPYELPIGIYVLSAAHPDYFPIEQQFILEPGEQETVTLELKPRPAKLRLLVTPEEADWVLAQGNQGLQPNESGLYILPPNETLEFQLVARDYYIARKSIPTTANEDIVWEIELQPLPGPEKGQEYQVFYANIPLVWIPAGESVMGSPIEEHRRLPAEAPLTNVEVPTGFWMGKHEVTQAQYQAVTGKNPSRDKGENLPVTNVSLVDAQAFLTELNVREKSAGRLPEGYAYALPTEAQWEYAARAGTTTPFSFGEVATPKEANTQLYYPEREGRPEDPAAPLGKPVEAGTYAPNAWGLTEVHGNVAEWTRTPYTQRLPGDTINAHTAPAIDLEDLAQRYAVRGGSYNEPARRARSAARDLPQSPLARTADIGLRIVLAPVD